MPQGLQSPIERLEIAREGRPGNLNRDPGRNPGVSLFGRVDDLLRHFLVEHLPLGALPWYQRAGEWPHLVLEPGLNISIRTCSNFIVVPELEISDELLAIAAARMFEEAAKIETHALDDLLDEPLLVRGLDETLFELRVPPEALGRYVHFSGGGRGLVLVTPAGVRVPRRKSVFDFLLEDLTV